MRQQHTMMKFDPTSGEQFPYPSSAAHYREYHGRIAWLYNPWTGDKRDLRDVGSDVDGLLILPPGERVYAARASEEFVLMSETVEQAAEKSGFRRTYSCCDVPQKFCSGDVWQGELRAYSVALLRLLSAAPAAPQGEQTK